MMPLKIAKWAIGVAVIIALMAWADTSDREDCEVRIAKELGTTAKYIDGKCMVKGYGRINGR